VRKTLQDTEISKQRIIEAAEQEFLQYGYVSAKIENIAKRTNMTKGAVFWHYKTKLRLFKVVLLRSIERLRKIVKEIFATDKPVVEQLRDMIMRIQKERSFEIVIQLGKIGYDRKDSRMVLGEIQGPTTAIFRDILGIMEKAKRNGGLNPGTNVMDMMITMTIFMAGFSQAGTMSDLLLIKDKINFDSATKMLFKGFDYYRS